MMVVAHCIKTMAFKLGGDMNERIQELAVEANDQTGNEFDLNYKKLDAFLEKFAELIVKECADRIDDLVTCDDDGNQILDCDDVRTELLEHFGVEE
jgi:hypothetical protein